MTSKDYPQEGDLVIATVTKIQYHSIFCDLDEYEKKSAMIHISEVAPGRIRNISDYLKEGKSVVAKVLRVDAQKGHIDLSIRRVTDAQRKQKASSRKQEKLVSNIIEQLASDIKSTPQELRAKLEETITEYDLFDAFRAVVEQETTFTDLGIDESLAQKLTQYVQDRIKPKRVSIKGDFTLQTYASDGIARIRAAFSTLPENVTAAYRGAGVYAVEVGAKEYKAAEKVLQVVREQIQSALGSDASIQFSRTDKK